MWSATIAVESAGNKHVSHESEQSNTNNNNTNKSNERPASMTNGQGNTEKTINRVSPESSGPERRFTRIFDLCVHVNIFLDVNRGTS